MIKTFIKLLGFRSITPEFDAIIREHERQSTALKQFFDLEIEKVKRFIEEAELPKES